MSTKNVDVGGALTLVADYIRMHHIDWLVMNGGFVGTNIAAYELNKFKGKETVRTFFCALPWKLICVCS